ncbi:MAG: SUMF1/EgtB/PvdO family nonheme iron enzyme [Desulfamplus sp.]|nr:SUMF1/EgtB/PvdO family nonheme iron enzyme [Desulfamplus sp.]
MNPKTMCMGCMKEKTSSTPLCPRPLCGYDESERRSPLVLKHRTLLADQYVVGKVLGKPGGFGITYLGWDTRLETMVAIKEYLPRDNAGRDTDQTTVVAHSREDEELFRFGLEAFLMEARTLAKFKHANVVRVVTFFEANSTAYLVMDYYDGMSLEHYLIEKGGRIAEKLAIDIMMPILDGLREVHEKGFLHRDIKPQNIYLTQGGLPILLDFGAARFVMGERSRSLTAMMTAGYAPYEQYNSKGRQGSWTDIYACGATLYRMVTGKVPPAAMDRIQDDDLIPPDRFANVSLGFHDAVMQALSVNSAERPQSVRQFQDILFNISSNSAPQLPFLRNNLKIELPAAPPQPPQKHIPVDLDIKKILKAGDLIDGPLPNMQFVYIPPGEFMMGSPEDELGRSDDEIQHKVRLTKGFYMQTTQVTQGQWKQVMGNNPSYFKDCGNNCPVEQVSWEDAQEFIKKINQQGGRLLYRLPTEAEWEYACRAGTTGAYAGNLDAMGWYNDNADNKIHPVAQKQPNALESL